MLNSRTTNHVEKHATRLVLIVAGLMLAGLLGLAVFTPFGAWLRAGVTSVLVTDSVQTSWFVTRAAGLVAYLLLWLSTAWGLVVTSRIADGILPRRFAFDAHEFLSLLALVFTGVHMGALLFDHFQPFSIGQLLVPLTATYRPLWVGVGIIALYLTAAVTITFYLRQRIGAKTFRAVHYLSFPAYLGAALHGWFAGTDTGLISTQWVYMLTLALIVFLAVFRVLVKRPAAA